MSYWSTWRASHPEYRQREAERKRIRRSAMTPEQRRADRGTKPKRPVPEPVPILMPVLQRGGSVSFWDDELRLDLAQEAALALIEGRDPRAAVEVYRQRETRWHHITCPFLLDGE